MIEDLATMPSTRLRRTVVLQKRLCKGASFLCPGPAGHRYLPGYDHIRAPLAVIAGKAGGGFSWLCHPFRTSEVTFRRRCEGGVIATRMPAMRQTLRVEIRGHFRGLEMSKARRSSTGRGQVELSIDPEKANGTRRGEIRCEDVCTMCGEFCA